MARCVDSDVQYDIRNDESLLSERKHLLKQNVNIRMRPINDTEGESSQFLPDHMHPLDRDEDNQHRSTTGMLVCHQPTVRTHCHVPATSEDTVARNQLIAISVLCFVFMVAEVIGEVSSMATCIPL